MNRKDPTHYEVLGIARNATEAEIKTAYRKHALVTHPDKTGGKSSDQFLKVSSLPLSYDTILSVNC